MNGFVDFDIQSVSVSLIDLATVTFTPPPFRPLSDFTILSLIYHGDYSSLFTGLLDSHPVLLETCTRIPFSLVCREIKLLADLRIPNTVKLRGFTKHPSLGVITLAYESVDFQPWTDPIPPDRLPHLLLNLLEILARLHERDLHHSFVCRASVYVSPDFDSLNLGSFHTAGKVGELAPFVVSTSCSPPVRCERDLRRDDVYAAGLWCVSYLADDPRAAAEDLARLEIDKRLRRVLQRIVDPDADARATAEEACAALREFAGS
jgi:hypothetical protein